MFVYVSVCSEGSRYPLNWCGSPLHDSPRKLVRLNLPKKRKQNDESETNTKFKFGDEEYFEKSKGTMDQGGGGLFMMLPPELLLEILNHLSLSDIAKLHCVSKWFDDRISSVMPSEFRRFQLTYKSSNEEERQEFILETMKKTNGQLNLSDLLIFGQCEDQDLKLIKILYDYKNNISLFGMQLLTIMDSGLVSFLQHESTRFRFLKKLTINSGNLIVRKLLKKHVEQLYYQELNSCVKPKIPLFYPNMPKFSNLETLSVDLLTENLVSLLKSCCESLTKLRFTHEEPPNIPLQQVPDLPKLQTLEFHSVRPGDLITLLNACSESLSKLSLSRISEEVPNIPLPQVPDLPKLQTLEIGLVSLGVTGKSLISKCRQTLTGIIFHGNVFEMEDTYFPKLKYLNFDEIPNLDIEVMISSNACLETLILTQCYDLILPNPLYKLKNVYSHQSINLANILKCASSLQCLALDDYHASDFMLKGIKMMPNLTDFYLLNFTHTGNWFVDECITDLLVKNADTLEFLVLDEHYNSSTTEIEIMKSITPVELKKVHTLIYLHYNPLLGFESEFLKSLCPNAHIMIKHTDEVEDIVETVKSRLKYIKADDIFFDFLYSVIFEVYDFFED